MVKNSSLNPFVSIVIRAKNEEKYFEKCLKAINLQTYSNYEIILVDSGSIDRTLDIAKKYQLKIYKIPPEDFTFGYALNFGTSKANGEFIVYISAHAIPKNNDWLKELVIPLNENKVDVAFSRQLPIFNAYKYIKTQMIKFYPKTKKNSSILFSNASSILKKVVWEQIKFNEKVPGCEDYLWAKQILKNGYKIGYVPKSLILHSHNESFKEIFNRSFREEIVIIKFKHWLNRIIYLVKRIILFIVNFLFDSLKLLFLKYNFIDWFQAIVYRFAVLFANFKFFFYGGS